MAFKKISLVFLIVSWVMMALVTEGILGGDPGPYEKAPWAILGGLAAQAITIWMMAKRIWRERRSLRNALARGIGTGVGVFMIGVLVGSIINTVIAYLSGDGSPVGETVVDYGLKPLYWLSIFGIPCAAMLGALYGMAVFRIAGRTAGGAR